MSATIEYTVSEKRTVYISDATCYGIKHTAPAIGKEMLRLEVPNMSPEELESAYRKIKALAELKPYKPPKPSDWPFPRTAPGNSLDRMHAATPLIPRTRSG